MVKEVKGYQTTSGKFFLNKEDAIIEQKNYDLNAALSRMLHRTDLCYNDCCKVEDFIKDNLNEIILILNNYTKEEI